MATHHHHSLQGLMTQTYAGRLVLRLPKPQTRISQCQLQQSLAKDYASCEYTLDLMFQLQSRGCIYTAAVSKLRIKWKSQGATVHINSQLPCDTQRLHSSHCHMQCIHCSQSAQQSFFHLCGLAEFEPANRDFRSTSRLSKEIS